MSRSRLSRFFAVTCLALAPSVALGEPRHGIAMYGDPALPPDFVSLPYANPDAPKGGVFVSGETGSFDSLNPHIRKGSVPWQLRFLAYESLMGRSWGEPFSLYGLLAESIDVGPEGDWVEFQLRPEARFSDGSPVTVEDVLWSYETLGTVGHPRYHNSWKKVASAEAVGERGIRFTFNVQDRELALIMGMRPILKKAQWDGKDFAESGIETIPISSAPYVVDDFEAGRFLSLKRNPDYWGKDVPFRRGTNNFDEIRMEFYGDGTALFEAFKGGAVSALRETNAAKWEEQYDFPAVQNGDVVKSLVPHQRPSGMSGFVFNLRKPIFQDWRVREALILAFNFEFINQTVNNGQLPRITSYFSNSVLGMKEGPANGLVKEYLEPFAADLLPGAMDGYTLPVASDQRNRANLRTARGLLEEAGWTVKDGVLQNASGEPFTFEIMLDNGSRERETIINIYTEALEQLGISPSLSRVDSAVHKERSTEYDYDMIYYRWGLSLSPGNEQRRYWGAAGVTEPGSRNRMGMNSPAAEAMIDRLVTSPSQDAFLAATRALDRILISGRYVIPIWHNPISRIAHKKEIRYPTELPIYGDWIGFMPDVFWHED